MQWVIVLLLLGVSFTLWMSVGTIRLVEQRHGGRKGHLGVSIDASEKLSAINLAVVIPAHNEEVTIGATLESAMGLVPAGNIHVVADGCDDSTAAIAQSCGVNVLTVSPARGKAAGIDGALQHFDLCRRFDVLLILDADTQLDGYYVERGLALLDDPEMAAVAGYAHTTWRPEQLTMVGRFLVSYRTRLYAVMQWIKYGQTWRYTNVTPIVPGFASMYRTRALSQMDLNPPGLVIEDFNMTFELHRKRLGKIAFEPSVFGRTQDPDNLSDYYRQIKRWWLGFWQTLRRHGLWFSWFSAALSLFLVEIVVASLVMALAALAVMLLALAPLTGGLVLEMGWYTSLYGTLSSLLSPMNLLLFVFIPDYLLTCAVAVWMRRPSLLVYGLSFLFIRVIDSMAALWTVRDAWRTKSTGRWNSPRRRMVSAPTAAGGAARAGPGESGSAVRSPVAAGSEDRTQLGRRRFLAAHVSPVMRDAVLVSTVLGLAVWIVVVVVPLTMALSAGLLALAVGGVWSHRRRCRASGGG
ncbi:MAG: glycosyltransferase family 2 protein [Pseudonocardiaceae bacterium]